MKGGVLFLFLSLLLLRPVLAYDQHSTHPSLTNEIAEFFNGTNTQTDRRLSVNEMQWLRQGAVEEDEPARWVNHFYDPVHGVGWSGKHFGNLTPEEGYKQGGDIAPRHSLASIDWVTNQDYQSAYGRQFGNQTWQKAIKSYLDGDERSAFIALGHVLHLVEDATVPDHVRDDSHPGIEGDPGSPYEAFSKTQTDAGSLNTAENLLKNKTNFKKLTSVNQAIKDLAVYVNKNFFSEDTISNDEFPMPKIDSLTIKTTNKVSYLFNQESQIYLARLSIDNGFSGQQKISTADTSFVLPSYRDHLFPEAVLTGGSVINLFFDEVEKYKQHPELLEPIVVDKNDSFLTALKQAPKRTVLKACGISESACKSMYNSLDTVASAVRSVPQKVSTAVTGVVNNLLGSAKSKLGLGNNQAASQNPPELVSATNSSILPTIITTQPVAQTPSIIQTVPNKTSAASKPPPKQVISPKIPVSVVPITSKIITNPVPTTQLPAQKIIYQGNGPSTVVPVSGNNNPSAVEGIPATPTPDTSTTTLENIASTTADDTVLDTTSSPTTTIFSSSTSDISTTTMVVTTTEVATPTPPEEVVDTSAPSVPVLTFINQSGPSSTNILISLESSDVSLPIYFDIEVAVSSTDSWQSLATSTTSTTVNFSGIRGQAYYFRARATDSVGNVSDWSLVSSPVFVNWSGEVVVNEIAWAGTSASYPNDEWLELRNNTDQPVDFSGWKIIVSGKEISFKKINNKLIPAHGYYLLERTTDDAVKEITADVVYSLTGGFNNSGEKIELIKPNGEKSDEVNSAGGWFAGDTILYKTMERINSLINGSDPANWQSNQGFRETGRTFNGGQIYGSPKRSNFGFIALNFNQDDAVRVLTKANNPYILQSYAVPVGKKLLIQPGVVIKSYSSGAKIDIFGSVEALGSTDQKITFTSGRDMGFADGLENTTIGSWAATTSAPQDWQGLWLHPSSTAVLDNVMLRYAGKGFVVPPNALPVNQAVRLDNANITISHSEFSDNGLVTLFQKNSNSTISNTIFANGERALESENSSLAISDSSFKNFTHTLGPVFIKDKWPALSHLSYADNILNMPFLNGVTVTEPQVAISEDERVLLNVFKVAPSSTLTIEKGASVYVPLYGALEVYGSLHANGTVEKPITFSPKPGDPAWGNIRFYNSHSDLNYVNFIQGNRLNGRPENLNGMIVANDSTITIHNSNLSDSEANSVQSNNSTIEVSDTNISVIEKNNNTRGIKALSGNVRLNNVNFNNLYIGLESGSSDVSALVVDVQNMSSSSFSNVDYFWQPLNLWSFPLPTVENLINP